MNVRPHACPPRLFRRQLALCLALALGGELTAVAAATHAPADSLEHFLAATRNGEFGRHFRPENFARFEARLRARLARQVGALPPPHAPTTQTVSNCNDSGAGSLRSAMTAAGNGETVDMTQLTCSLITLSSAIATHVDGLTVHGRGQQSLTIDAGGASSAFLHYGGGTLTLTDMTVTHGRYAIGGCITSLGSVSLSNVTVTACTATGYAGYADGGGVFAAQNMTLTSSTISNNDAYDASFSGFRAYGGGAFAHGTMTITGSTLRANTATTGGAYVGGGGVLAVGTLTIANSTFSLNTAIDVVGADAIGGGAISAADFSASGSTFESNHASLGAGLAGAAATSTLTVVNSTVTGNDGALAGGIISLAPLHLRNSTVAFNYAGASSAGAGMLLSASSEIQSSIIADNYAGTGCTERCRPYYEPASVSGGQGVDLSSNGAAITISGANNLIVDADPAISLPAGTLHVEPMLAPFLENNGGPTQTLALNANSPAIDAGNNIAGLATDQRGAGYARVAGAAADIGAFEVQSGGSGDEIFRNGFD